jgi:glycosyltransferase involved in cell wall biosynthesis
VRALYVNHTSRISGGELSLITLLEALPAGVEPTVACPEGALADRARGMGVDVISIRGTDGSLRLHPTRTPLALLEMGQAALGVRKAASTTRADVVHANSIRAGIISVAAGGDRPTVVHVRDCLPGGAVSDLTLRVINRADALVANSAYTRSTLGPGKAAAHVVHNAVDLSRFDRVRLTPAESRARLGLGEQGPVLAVIAQITPWKGQDDAIRVAQELVRSHPRLQLLLVGSPKFDSAATRYDNNVYLEELRRQVAEQGLTDSVCFLGERDDIPEVLRAVDLLLVPSWEEPFGRAIIEAMASGVPVVATDVGGPPEILVEGEARYGLVLPPRSPDAWASAIRELLADPARLSEMGERGREAAQHRFGVERHVAAVLNVYAGVAGAAAIAP